MRITNAYCSLYLESSVEIARLINLDRMTTAEIGGIFAGLSETELPILENVLDLGCGPGSWVLDVAFANPTCEVAGIDIRRTMIEYAWARARTQRLFNASFGVMDITRPLDFSHDSFNLVHARFLAGILHNEIWMPLVAECLRILCPGGLLCLVDTDGIVETNSAALSRLNALLMRAMRMGGYGLSFDEGTPGTAWVLPQLLRRAGFQQVQCTTHFVDVSAGTTTWADFFHNVEIVYLQAQSLLLATGLVTQQEIDRLYTQMLIELQMLDFWGRWPVLRIVGTK
jgi:SAM-dependent methyltransferase